jgi:hypothetical protein
MPSAGIGSQTKPHLMEIALSKFQIFAGTLADDAAAISMAWFRRHPDIDTKPDRMNGYCCVGTVGASPYGT